MFRIDHLIIRILAMFGSPAAQLATAGHLSQRHAYSAAFCLLMKAANAGLPAAWYQLGYAYLVGRGVPLSLSAALRWLTRAAEAEEIEAQTLLASLALHGKCEAQQRGIFDVVVPAAKQHPNYHIALHWAERAATHESAEAQAILGFLLIEGPSDLRNYEGGERYYRRSAEAGCTQGELGWALVLLRRGTQDAVLDARRLLEKAAAAGSPTAQYIMGVLAESGTAGDQDFVIAAEYYRTAAEAGHRAAQLRFGITLLIGRGVPTDTFNGESWLRRAALAGESAAAAIVGDLYTGQGGLPPNYVEAATWLRLAAEAGHTGAARTLGHLLLGGAGLAPDIEDAARWLRLAISGGHTEAWDDLARLALAGQVPDADRKTTCAWFRQQAEAGDPSAAFNLGLCLAEGLGTPRNDLEALAWFERAAASVPNAQYWCGRMCAEGRGCAVDPRAARRWFLRASLQCHADADVAAGEMLFNGRGGPADRPTALTLFRRAAAAGHPGALFALDVLAGYT